MSEYKDEYENVVEVYPNLKYKPCEHCGKSEHYYWNCPQEREKENARIKEGIMHKLDSITDKNTRTVKFINQLLQSSNRLWTTQEIADRANVSANTARKWLYRLKIAGMVKFKTHYYGRGIYLYLWSR